MVKFIKKLTCLLFLSAFLLPSSSSSCTSCVNSFIELETCLLADNGNMESLIQAFYPTNKYPALWVEVKYYCINETRTTIGPDSQVADHVFYWASSPVLVFVPPLIMKGASVQLIQIDESLVAHLVVPSLCHDNSRTLEEEEKISLDLLNNVTAWLKTYAVLRGVSEGLDTSLQGYAIYYNQTTPSNNELLVLTGTSTYSRYETQMIVSLVLICLVVFMWGPYKLNVLQPYLHEMSKCPITQSKQQFRFKSIMWSFVIALVISAITISCIDLHFFITYILPWENRHKVLFYALICSIVVFVLIDGIIASLLTWKGHYEDKLIEVPRLLLCIFDANKSIKWNKLNKCHKGIAIILQFTAYFTCLVMLLLITIHGCGIVLALLAHPIQAFSRVVVALTVVVTFVILCTYVLEVFEPPKQDKEQSQNGSKGTKKPKEKQKKNKQFIDLFCNCFTVTNNQIKDRNNRGEIQNNEQQKADDKDKKKVRELLWNTSSVIIRIITSFIFTFCLYLFLDTYISATLYVGNDSTGVVDSIAQIFPALALSFLGWIIKREYDNFNLSVKAENEKEEESLKDICNSLKDICQSLNVRDQSPLQDIQQPLNDIRELLKEQLKHQSLHDDIGHLLKENLQLLNNIHQTTDRSNQPIEEAWI